MDLAQLQRASGRLVGAWEEIFTLWPTRKEEGGLLWFSRYQARRSLVPLKHRGAKDHTQKEETAETVCSSPEFLYWQRIRGGRVQDQRLPLLPDTGHIRLGPRKSDELDVSLVSQQRRSKSGCLCTWWKKVLLLLDVIVKLVFFSSTMSVSFYCTEAWLDDPASLKADSVTSLWSNQSPSLCQGQKVVYATAPLLCL